MGNYLRLLRPSHWSKNVFVFAGLIFAEHAEKNLLFDIAYVLPVIATFCCFCLLSSTAYIINDIADAKQDRLHPTKRFRPIAAGTVSISAAIVIAVVLAIAGLSGSFAINILVGMVTTSYLILNLLYSWWLKDHVIVDVMCIAIGFVFRALAGVMAINVPLSPWLVVCTFTLCMFLAFGKRRCEIALWANDLQQASNHRPVLKRYSPELLGHLLSISAAIAVVSFLLYTMDPQTSAKFGTNYLIYTTPLVIYGIFRFAVLIQTSKVTGPVQIITRDWPFQLTVLIWVGTTFLIVHWGTVIQGYLHALRDL